MRHHAIPGRRGATNSHETCHNAQLAPRHQVRYRCPHEHPVAIFFAADAAPPPRWRCSHHSVDALREDLPVPSPAPPTEPVRTHWDMVRERRSIAELEQLLHQRLDFLRARRASGETTPAGSTHDHRA
ncbi:RNA polymerase-binding protein RbpA [Streptoalloteichus hindustanus]|uniref:RNA polymerase-binding protein RbpA n=1 Tax=Streptoalloteichus hindustanus TaxID=2017 RepID=A0A1M5HZE9_STRHI|nr:RNA polymerase-binding protein RbpA [Streptoalloteichus hindustanus]SHG21179.1 RNA polymerase-binding protein [Streptoalloteichus hindustanus]